MSRPVRITTAGRSDEETKIRAAVAAQVLGYEQVPRKKQSVQTLMDAYDADVLVASKQRYELYRKGVEGPLFFHPDTAAFRLKRLMRNEHDPLIDAAKLQSGDSFLDCTLGLATDSIVASYAVGSKGWVTGIEANPDVAFIVADGLTRFEPKFQELQDAMRRIQVIPDMAVHQLAELADASWDVVYIDPMFSTTIDASTSFAPLRAHGVQGGLTAEWMSHATRVANKRVVVKAHFNDPVFQMFGFQQLKRPNTKFHFGYLET